MSGCPTHHISIVNASCKSAIANSQKSAVPFFREEDAKAESGVADRLYPDGCSAQSWQVGRASRVAGVALRGFEGAVCWNWVREVDTGTFRQSSLDRARRAGGFERLGSSHESNAADQRLSHLNERKAIAITMTVRRTVGQWNILIYETVSLPCLNVAMPE